MSSGKSFTLTGHFRGHKPVICQMYNETDFSSSFFSDSEKSAEKWQ
jgi:hypothetical protein